MSRRREKARPCPTATKTGWGAKADAEEALAVILAQSDAWREKLPCRVYRCECGAWHLTSVQKDDDSPPAPSTVPPHVAAAARIHAAATRA